MKDSTTTIAALATAPAPAGIAVIRISGPKTRMAIRALFRAKKDPITLPREIIFGDIIDFETGKNIDRSLCFFMPGPFSFTGEDVGEFQFHGSPLLVQKILHSLYASGISPAEPGEFTKRAFLHGKLDLVQAEAIADLISAQSEQALKLAGEQLEGRFSASIERIGDPLRDALAELEAGIDFTEEDIPPLQIEQTAQRASTALKELERLLGTYAYGSVVREGFRVLICGRPNAGKSSLLNAVLGKNRAIVTEISGTTRDLIEETMTIGGYRFVLCDSAGITETTDSVERIGVQLAKDRMSWADLVFLVADASDETEQWKEIRDELRGKAQNVWMIINKIDLNPKAIGNLYCDSQVCERNFYLSALTHTGVDALIDALRKEVENRVANSPDASVIVTNERHRACLSRASDHLRNMIEGAKNKAPTEILSADLRGALYALNEVIGKTSTEEILGRIFSRFCIGK